MFLVSFLIYKIEFTLRLKDQHSKYVVKRNIEEQQFENKTRETIKEQNDQKSKAIKQTKIFREVLF